MKLEILKSAEGKTKELIELIFSQLDSNLFESLLANQKSVEMSNPPNDDSPLVTPVETEGPENDTPQYDSTTWTQSLPMSLKTQMGKEFYDMVQQMLEDICKKEKECLFGRASSEESSEQEESFEQAEGASNEEKQTDGTILYLHNLMDENISPEEKAGMVNDYHHEVKDSLEQEGIDKNPEAHEGEEP